MALLTERYLVESSAAYLAYCLVFRSVDRSADSTVGPKADYLASHLVDLSDACSAASLVGHSVDHLVAKMAFHLAASTAELSVDGSGSLMDG